MSNMAPAGDPGFEFNPRAEGPAPEWIARFRAIPAAVIGDCMGRLVGTRNLRPYHQDPATVLCGPALTIRVRPGDNLMIHAALHIAQPGDVIVIDGGADLAQAVVGGLIKTSCEARQVAGLVVDGALRDVREWADGTVPVFARGHTLRGPSKDGPGQVNVVVACDGLVVHPGDLVVGDADGVVAIPKRDVERIYGACIKHLEREEAIREKNRSGAGSPERFAAILAARGVAFPPSRAA